MTEARTETEASRQLVVDYFTAMRSHDAVALALVLADDVEWIPPQSAPVEGRPYVGRDTVVAAMDREGSRFFDLSTGKVGAFKIVADADTVVVLYGFACTTRAGRDYSNEYVFVFTCQGNRITRIVEHNDTHHFHQVVMSE